MTDNRADLLAEIERCITAARDHAANTSFDWRHAWLLVAETLARAAAEIRALEVRSRTRPDYDLRCQECGAPHWLDTSIPSAIWNQIADPSDILCLLCIDDRLTAKGLRAEAEFYFVGESLQGRVYTDAHGKVQALERQLKVSQARRGRGWELECIEARDEVTRLRAELAALRQDRERLAEALERIKNMVCGEKVHRWADDYSVTMTRGKIADIIDAALDAARQAGRTEG